MTKKEYLKKFIYEGLTNLNTGFDSPTIYYFNEAEFQIILDRVKKLGLGIYGIEPFDSDLDYFDTKVYENYNKEANDPDWYNRGFQEFLSLGEELIYAASFHVPDELLKKQ